MGRHVKKQTIEEIVDDAMRILGYPRTELQVRQWVAFIGTRLNLGDKNDKR